MTYPTETFVEQTVTYTLEHEGRLFVIENVPARICVETGEKLFAPQTVDRIHAIVHGHAKPSRVMQMPIFDFAA